MQLRLQARYSLFVVGLLSGIVAVIVGLHLMELRAMFAATSRTYSEVMATALFDQLRKQGEDLGKHLAAEMLESIKRGNSEHIHEAARVAGQQDAVLGVAAYGPDGRVLGEYPVGAYRQGPAPGAPVVKDAAAKGTVVLTTENNVLYVISPVRNGDRRLGWIKIGLSLAAMNADIESVRNTVSGVVAGSQRRFVAIYIAVAVVMVLLGFGITLIMVRGLVQPIQALSRYTRRIGAGNYDDAPPVERSDELGDLSRALGQMAHDLKQVAQVARLATLGEMAVGMAHELSQPLNTIRLAAENTLMAMEQGKADSEFERKKLALIAQQAESMGELIKRMCVVGRSEGPQEAIDPRESVRDAYSLMSGQFEAEGIAVTLEVPERCGPVLGRRNELARVVINLLTNARDAIIENALSRNGRLAPAGGRIEIVVQSVAPGAVTPLGEVRIKVKDNGGGVPPGVMGRIFDPFFTTKEVTKGTGLGLSISYGIVNAMGGRLTVENFGGGALFTINLPVVGDMHGKA